MPGITRVGEPLLFTACKICEGRKKNLKKRRHTIEDQAEYKKECPLCKKVKCKHTARERVGERVRQSIKGLTLDDGSSNCNPRRTGVRCVIPECSGQIIEEFEIAATTAPELVPIGPASRNYYQKQSRGLSCGLCGVKYAALPRGKMNRAYERPLPATIEPAESDMTL